MKCVIAFFITSTLSLAALANGQECGQLTVNGEGSFTLIESNNFAVDFTASGMVAQELVQHDRASEVCVEIKSGRDEYGGPANEAVKVIK